MTIKQILIGTLIGSTAFGLAWHEWSNAKAAPVPMRVAVTARPGRRLALSHKVSKPSKMRQVRKKPANHEPWLASRKLYNR